VIWIPILTRRLAHTMLSLTHPLFPLDLLPRLLPHLDTYSSAELNTLCKICQEANRIFIPILYQTLILNEHHSPFDNTNTNIATDSRTLWELSHVRTFTIRQPPSRAILENIKSLINTTQAQNTYLFPNSHTIHVDVPHTESSLNTTILRLHLLSKSTPPTINGL
jgi:hypothetical protein